jgi:hypothetical protein
MWFYRLQMNIIWNGDKSASLFDKDAQKPNTGGACGINLKLPHKVNSYILLFNKPMDIVSWNYYQIDIV